jgi:general secretion pathway protein N
MSSISKICVVGCFWLVATVAAFGVANPAGLDTSETGAAAAEGPQPSPAQQPLVAQAGQRPNANPLWGIPLKQLSATRDRPIFSASRRPPPTAVAPAAAVVAVPVQAPKPPERPQLSLVGTIVNGADGFAIFVDQSTRAPLRIRMGADYQGWMLRQIEARSVTLQKGQEVAVLSFPPPASNQAMTTGASLAQIAPVPAAPSPIQTAPYLSPESNALRMPARQRGNSAGRRL